MNKNKKLEVLIIMFLLFLSVIVIMQTCTSVKENNESNGKIDFTPKEVETFETRYIHVGISEGWQGQGPCITEMWSMLDYPNSVTSEPHDVFGLGEYEYIQVDDIWSDYLKNGNIWFRSNDRFSITWNVMNIRIEKYVELSKTMPAVIISYRITNLDSVAHKVNFYVATDIWEDWTNYPYMDSRIYDPYGNVITKSGWYDFQYVIEQLHTPYPFEPGEDWVFMGVEKGIRARVYVGWWSDAITRSWGEGYTIIDGDVDKGFLIEVGSIASGESIRFKVYYGVSDSFTGVEGIIKQLYWQNIPPYINNGWAVIVGIADYSPPGPGGPDLSYSDDDAIDFYNKLIEWGWDSSRIHLLLNSDATKTNIISQVEWLVSNVQPDDLVIFFFSGHGTYITDPQGEEADGRDEALVSHDLDLITDDELEILLSGIKVQSIIVILDSCYSGGFIEKSLGEDIIRVKTLPGKELVKLQDGFEEDLRDAGRVVLTCGSASETCLESSLYENGVWTYWILQALGSSPPPSDENKDIIITAEETYIYAANELAHSPFSDYQHPQLYDGSPGQTPLVWHLTPVYIYWFTWYDMVGASWDAIHLTNIGSITAKIEIFISGSLKSIITLSPGQSAYTKYPGLRGGPVKILSTQPLSVTRRILGWNSFNEIPAMLDEMKSMTIFYNWYDMVGASWDAIHIINPSGKSATVKIYIGGVLRSTITVPPEGQKYITYPGLRAGPIILESNVPILSTRRIIGWNSFDEVIGVPLK